MARDTVKVLLDTDIGSDIDDAVALAYLLCQEKCELLGVTTVSGQPVLRAELASAICTHAGRGDVPIHAGCAEALLVDMKQTEAQQAAALGDWARRKDFQPATAVEFLRRTIRDNPGEVTLLAIGPMTNVGALFAADPEVPGMLKQLVLMCGSFFDPPRGEWNAINDPHATAIVYGAGRRAQPPRHVSFGLDVTMQCVMDADEVRNRFTGKVLEPVLDFAEVWFGNRDHLTFHDPLAAACIFEPDICEYVECGVNVSFEPDREGWTLIDEASDTRPHTVARDVNPERFFEHYFEVVK